MVVTATFILSGLFDGIIDVKVTVHTSIALEQHQLAEAEVVELLTAVLAGNSNTQVVPGNP